MKGTKIERCVGIALHGWYQYIERRLAVWHLINQEVSPIEIMEGCDATSTLSRELPSHGKPRNSSIKGNAGCCRSCQLVRGTTKGAEMGGA